MEENKVILKHGELGSLTEIAEVLWVNMLTEMKTNGSSNLTLIMEGSVLGIREILKINNIKE